MTTERKPHLSPTQLDTAGMCMERYRRRYMEGEKIPPGIAMMRGTGFHGGARTNFRQKIESHKDLPANEIADAAAAAFEAATKDGFTLSKEESFRGAKVVLGETKDAVVNLAKVHAAQQAPLYQPVFVEEKIVIELPASPRDLWGVIDVADDKDRVVDFKTAGRSKTQSDADSSIQLTTYSASFTAKTGRIPLLVLDTLVQTKTKTYRNALQTTRNETDMDNLVARINTLIKAIEKGVFPPTAPGAWWCSERWCGFWSTCPYVNTERKAAASDD